MTVCRGMITRRRWQTALHDTAVRTEFPGTLALRLHSLSPSSRTRKGGIFTDQNMNAIVMGIKNIRLMTERHQRGIAEGRHRSEEMTQEAQQAAP